MGFCTREAMQVPRGERYELCRSVHAEANAIISASRRDMVGSTLYLVGRDGQTGAAGRRHQLCHVPPPGHQRRHHPGHHPPHGETEFKVVDVNDWVHQEDDVPAL